MLQIKIPHATMKTENPVCHNYELVQPKNKLKNLLYNRHRKLLIEKVHEMTGTEITGERSWLSPLMASTSVSSKHELEVVMEKRNTTLSRKKIALL